MSALTKNIGISNDNTSVTKISAQARIDYILRFSKQAILVIDESAEQSASLSNQFLATLPELHNAAYISLSAQFNDIQIRCRIIEQLNTGELFDPEISLAVSVINLAKKSKQSISIVLDNAQQLSLQILHELSQLAAIAKKANLVVNIVMFGSVQAGKTVAGNKSLFDNKLTLLSAQSGQLLTPTSVIFKNNQPKWYFVKQNKWLFSALIVLLGLTGVVINLIQLDSFNFSQSLIENNQEKVSLTKVLARPQTMVLSTKREIITELDESITTQTSMHVAAMPKDIYSLLITPLPVLAIKAQALPADIMSAITTENANSALPDVAVLAALSSQLTEQTTPKQNNLTNHLTINNDYYANKTGYVIQLAAFSDLKLPATFLATLETIDYHIYQRLLNSKSLMVITSSVYANKLAAKSALSGFPKSLLARQPWIKPITVVNNEINAFQLSQ